MRWGYGCKVGVYAQHVYAGLPDTQTVSDYLRSKGAATRKTEQEILTVAGAMLFRGSHVEKSIRVLSGGERARLVMAGLLLGDSNVLILDEPGNHLDVDTVDALVDALSEYQGTVIFTSHDRHFTRRVASCVVEVRDGRVTTYSGKYEAYLQRVNDEVDAGERETGRTKLPAEVLKPSKAHHRPRRDDKAVRKELKSVEKTIAALDGQRRELNAKLLDCSNAAEALRLHTEAAALTAQLAPAEERWCELQEEIGEAG